MTPIDNMLRSLALFLVLAAGSVSPVTAQAARSTPPEADLRVSAEMVRGKLNPKTSKPGDTIVLHLQEQVKSKGEILLTRGSTITGIVRKVRRIGNESGAAEDASAQSMMELEWRVPRMAGSSQQLSVALQSVIYANPIYSHQQHQEESVIASPVRPHPPTASRPSVGLIGGVSATAGAAISTVDTSTVLAGAAAQTETRTGTPPSIVPVNAETSSNLWYSFGVSGTQLFLVGSGQATSAGGTTTSMDLFSHMSNDTVITSPNRDFEVAAGAQMQLLVRASQSGSR